MTRPFLIALANHIASVAPTLKREAPGVELFACALDETIAADCHATLRAYDARPMTHVPMRHAAIQCETVGKPYAAADALAVTIFQRLTTDAGPIRETAIAGFTVKGVVNLRPPRPVRRDDKGRDVIVFNFEAFYIPA